MIKVLFFAQLREQLNCAECNVNVEKQISVAELRAQLVQQNPQWNNFLMNEKLLCAVNQVMVKPSHYINDGDEVAFFPPVTGG
jgi:sulfur-carrier protein